MKLIDLQEKVVTKNNIHFHIIPNKKFKTVNFVMKCKAPLDRVRLPKGRYFHSFYKKERQVIPPKKNL